MSETTFFYLLPLASALTQNDRLVLVKNANTNPVDSLALLGQIGGIALHDDLIDLGATQDGSVVTRLLGTASVTLAKLANDVVTVIQSGMDPAKYQGIWTPATNTPTIPAAAGGNSGQWYFVGAAGTATGNAAGTYAYGDTIASNGSAWLKRPAPPTVIPDASVTLAKLASDVLALMPAADDFNGYIEVRNDASGRTYHAVRTNGKTFVILDEAVVVNGPNLADESVSFSKLASDVTALIPETTSEYNGMLEVRRDPNGRAYFVARTNGRTWIILDETVVVNASNLAPSSVSYEKLASDVTEKFPGTEELNDYLIVWKDTNGRRLLAVRVDGTLDAKFPSSLDNSAFNAELVAARGTQPALNDRLSQVITPAGRLNCPSWGDWLMRSFFGLAMSIKGGASAKCTGLLIGDSWTHGGYYSKELFRKLATDLVAGGGGFCGFAYFNDSGAINGCVDDLFVTGSRSTGNWTQEFNISNGIYAMDGTHIKSSTVGASVAISILQAHTAVRIHYRKQSGGGTFRYRVNAGSWTNVSTDTTPGYGLETVTVPASACTIDIEVQTAGANGVIMNGLDAQRSTGIVMHKCGQSGGTASNFVNYINDTHFRDGVTALAPDFCIIMFGTNEQNGNVAPSALKANVLAIAQKVRDTKPLCDFLFMCPAANGLTGKAYTMAEYSAAVYDAAVEFGAGFISHQQRWGDFAEYEYTSDPTLSRNWMGSDGIHPTTTGGLVITQDTYNFLYNN